MENKMTAKEFRERMAIKHTKADNANQLTKAIVNYLNLHVGFAWRNNTGVIFDTRAAAKKILELAKIWVLTRKVPSLKAIEDVLRKCYRKGSNQPGESDIYCIEKTTGKLIAIEVKFGDDQISPDQKYFLQEVNRNKGIGIVARSLEDVIVSINKIITKDNII